MSVTIHDQPKDYTPSGNPVNWTFSSDQTFQANFSFLVEVFVDTVLQGRHDVFPDNGIFGRYDASSYAERFTSAPVIVTTLSDDAGNNASINIKITERYGDPITSHLSATSAARTVFKGKLRNKPFSLFDPSIYLMTTDGAQFLTLFPSATDNMKCADSEQQRLLVLSDNKFNSLSIELFDAGDTPFGGTTEVIGLTKIIVLNVGVASIVANTSITQANFDLANHYKIQAIDTVSGFRSVEQRIDIDRECRREGAKRIHFISTIGSIESFSYTLYSNEQAKVQSASMQREFGSWNGNSFDYSFQGGTKLDFQKTADISLMIRSNWLTEGEQNWLDRELSLSPLVLMEDPDEPGIGLIRVKLRKSNYEIKRKLQIPLFRDTFTVDLEAFTSMTT